MSDEKIVAIITKETTLVGEAVNDLHGDPCGLNKAIYIVTSSMIAQSGPMIFTIGIKLGTVRKLPEGVVAELDPKSPLHKEWFSAWSDTPTIIQDFPNKRILKTDA